MAASETLPGARVGDAHARAVTYLATRHHWRLAEALPWLLAIAAYFLFPDRMTFGSQVLLMVLFALSLDLILGYAGIVTLGHAAFFGLGAYTVGLLSARLGYGEPISGLFAAAAVAAVAGFISGIVLLRYRGLTLLVLTLSTTILLQEVGNLFKDFTGGYDGIPGITINPLFGVFTYDLYGRTNYIYCLCVLLVLFYIVRRIVYSPFGEALAGIRENVARMHAVRLAGALASGRRLYDLGGARGCVGRAVHADQCLRDARRVRFRPFRRRHGDLDPRRHRAALRRLRWRRHLHDPGGLSFQVEPGVLAVRHRPSLGDRGLVRAPWSLWRVRGCRCVAPQTGETMTTTALKISGLNKNFGALAVTRDVSLTLERGARHALIGPNGAGKTTLVNLITGVLKPSAGSVSLEGEDITSRSQATRVRLGIARTFQINQLFRGLTVLENVYMAVGERTGACNRLWRPAGAERAVIDEALAHLRLAEACRRCTEAGARAALRPAAAGRDCDRAGAAAKGACCSMNRRPACRRRKATLSSTSSARSIPTSRS